ncbi:MULTISPECIES: DUF6145 family protein [Vallitalea]|jgi:hypothetical protein|uniref:Uncharacterized protein n=1 Tax=Vallitalea guaymasensis TaxID=1185412 RepID=A0A8J8SBX9_9FIRM|nr:MULTISPECIES: DUF6145 family protein [Vallitalea]MCT4686469.1 DUF6145 family protein [Vallitalea sp.]QUH28841.1 hypothetical protein HYG85_07895 [Vallitalea guaymasensis]
MFDERVILCVSNAYNKKYYLNEDFEQLPQQIKDELKILSVLYTEDVGGILTIGFEESGDLFLEVEANENDLLFDEIGSGLKIKQMQTDKQELWESLEMFFRVFYLGEE